MNDRDLIKKYFEYVLYLVETNQEKSVSKKELTAVGAEALIYSLRIIKKDKNNENVDFFIKEKIKEIMDAYIQLAIK